MATHIFCCCYCACRFGDADISRVEASIFVYLITESQVETTSTCRIWHLTSSRTLFSVVMILAIPSFIMGMVTGIEATIIKVYVSWMLNYIKLTPTI